MGQDHLEAIENGCSLQMLSSQEFDVMVDLFRVDKCSHPIRHYDQVLREQRVLLLRNGIRKES